MTKNELSTKVDYTQVGEEISHDLAAKMIKDYQDAYPSESDFFFTGKNIITKLLAQPGCVGMRIYNAIDQTTGKPTLVYVGINENGQPILEYSAVNNDGRLERLKAMAVDKNGTGTEVTTSSWFGAK